MNSNADSESVQTEKNAEYKVNKTSNDFTIGLVTFVVFIVFMTAWMYFSV